LVRLQTGESRYPFGAVGKLTVDSIEDSVREDVALLKASPLISKSTQIVGLAYDIMTGVLTEVTDITEGEGEL
jgi:carbonic anhydrase